jgi:hypothetical protein
MDKRRDALKLLLAGGFGLVVLPKQWSAPLVESIILPAHGMTSCATEPIENINEAISLNVTATQVEGNIILPIQADNTFSGTETSRIDGCEDGKDLNVEVRLSGTINSANSLISGDLVIIQTCGDQLVCEQISTFTAAKQSLFEYIEVFYNRQRRHSYLDYVSPAEYEQANAL